MDIIFRYSTFTPKYYRPNTITMKKLIYLLIVFCTVTFVACDDKDNEEAKNYLKSNLEEISFDPEGNIIDEKVFEITTNVPWTISKTEDWITIDKTEGEGDAIITINAGINIEQSSRRTTLTLLSTDKAVTPVLITINQQGIKSDLNVFDKIVDEAFKAYCKEFDLNEDGILSPKEAAKVDRISISSLLFRVETLEGIQYFPNLTTLDFAASYNKSLDLSKNTKLKRLMYCFNSKLDKIDLSKNTELTYILFEHTAFTSIDLSHNKKIDSLECKETKNLKEINLGDNPSLKYFSIGENDIEVLDISQCINLEELKWYGTKYSKIDLIKNINLLKLTILGDQPYGMDLSNNTKLRKLAYGHNETENLDISKNIELEEIYCTETNIKQLDLSKNTKLKTLLILNGKLTDLDVSNNIELNSIKCYNNQINTLDVSKNINLDRLECYKNQITNLVLGDNSKLTSILCSNNQLSTLDVSRNKNIRYIDCRENPNLETLYVWDGFDRESITLHSNSQIKTVVKQ